MGLAPEPFADMFGLNDAALADRGAVRVTARSTPGYPCRITLEDAEPGETLILVNHVSHNVANPYRASHAIFVRESAAVRAEYVDALPPVMQTRVLSLRGFDQAGMMIDAVLTQPGEADAAIRTLFRNDQIVVIHAHNAVRGCYSARVERA